ncbi:hypothetical protein [Campylobacter geochelonis]|uniref:Uncharacterized protein n=1 Tax=Campylobacter geochelonis TaxID=1780362 RepID=A0A128EDY3_9BACT|nr:hypothetical protein [Campylobacter geochelonis]QKF71009.1 hypothetical protein CGEO_0688 [Campylobacter geochelonis]CZE47149.1 Uncharacterised protein [Campylobacter geochelonis]
MKSFISFLFKVLILNLLITTFAFSANICTRVEGKLEDAVNKSGKMTLTSKSTFTVSDRQEAGLFIITAKEAGKLEFDSSKNILNVNENQRKHLFGYFNKIDSCEWQRGSGSDSADYGKQEITVKPGETVYLHIKTDGNLDSTNKWGNVWVNPKVEVTFKADPTAVPPTDEDFLNDPNTRCNYMTTDTGSNIFKLGDKTTTINAEKIIVKNNYAENSNPAFNRQTAGLTLEATEKGGIIDIKKISSDNNIKFTLTKVVQGKCVPMSEVSSIRIEKGEKVYAYFRADGWTKNQNHNALETEIKSNFSIKFSPDRPTTCTFVPFTGSGAENGAALIGHGLTKTNLKFNIEIKGFGDYDPINQYYYKLKVTQTGTINLDADNPGAVVQHITKNKPQDGKCTPLGTPNNLNVVAGDEVYVYFGPSKNLKASATVNLSATLNPEFIPDKVEGTGWMRAPLNDGKFRPGEVINPGTPNAAKTDYATFKNIYGPFTFATNLPKDDNGLPTGYKIMQKKFGGAGKFFNGDYSITGASVLNSSNGIVNFHYGKASNVKKVAGFERNSASAKLYLPKDIKKDDIVYAKIFWTGHIQAAHKTIYDLPDIIKGYREIQFKAPGMPSPKTLEAKDGDTWYSASSSSLKNKDGATFIYSASYDVLTEVQKSVANLKIDSENKDATIALTFAAGNIKSSSGESPSLNRWIGGAASQSQFGNFANWTLLVVYNRKDAQAGDKYYKPKGITIYEGMAIQSAPRADPARSNLTLNFDGFYTPVSNNYDAKLSINSSGASPYGEAREEVTIADANDNYTMKKITNEDKQLNNNITVIKPGDSTVTTLESGHTTGFDLHTYNINQFMTAKQSKTSMNFETFWQDNWTNTSIISVVALSTDLYVPEVCFDETIYTAAAFQTITEGKDKCENAENQRLTELKKKELGVNSLNPSQIQEIEKEAQKTCQEIIDKGVSKFSAVAGDSIVGRTKFVNGGKWVCTGQIKNGECKDGDWNMQSGVEPAEGVIIKLVTKDNILYKKDSSKIDNSMEDKYSSGTSFSKKLVNIKDGDFGAFKDGKNGLEPIKNFLYDDKFFNEYAPGAIRYSLGKDAGSKDKSTGLVGGTFIGSVEKNDAKVAYLEFGATLGSFKDKIFTNNEYAYDFSALVCENPNDKSTCQKLSFGYGIAMQRCPTAKVNEIKVVLLDGLRVVNQNFNADNNDTRLYTQVSGGSFNGSMIFMPDLSKYDTVDCPDGVGKTTKSIDDTGAETTTKEKCVVMKNLDGYGNVIGEIQYIPLSSIDVGLQPFPLDGEVEISLVRGDEVRRFCNYLGTEDKIPFYYGNEYFGQEKDFTMSLAEQLMGKSELELKNFKIEDAFNSVTFMVQYWPKGAKTYGLNRGDTLEKCINSLGNVNPKPTSLEECREMLQKKDALAENWLGTKPAPDGSFHICNSDSFTVRPAMFKAKTENLDKYAIYDNNVLVKDSGTSTNETYIVDKTKSTFNAKKYRTGGNPDDNKDLRSSVIYAADINNNPTPNYVNLLGVDFGLSKVAVGSKAGQMKEVGTFLKPVLSGLCEPAANIQAVTQMRNSNKPLELKKLNDIGSFNDETKYNKDTGENNSEFDKNNFRIWDKEKNSLFANFDYIDDTGKRVLEGDWNKGKYREYMDKQARLKGEKKDKERYAKLYTQQILKADGSTKELQLNYFNVGDVSVEIYDNTFTMADQYDVFKGKKDTEEWPACVVGSAENKHNDKGLVGCDVKLEKELVTRFIPDRIELQLKNLVDTKKHTIAGVDYSYTFYNNPQTVGITTNTYGTETAPIANDAIIQNSSTGKLKDIQVPTLGMDVAAYLSDEVYANTLATLYTKHCYSRDVEFDLDMTYDCVKDSSDTRCVNRTGSVVDIAGKLGDKLGDTRGYNRNTANAADHFGFYALENLMSKPVINTDGSRKYDKRSGLYIASHEGFKDGKFPVLVPFGFDRTQTTANNPIVLYGNDFVARQLVADTANPTKSVAREGNKLYNEKDTKNKAKAVEDDMISDIAKSKFIPFDETDSNYTNQAVHFYYGNANAKLLKYETSSRSITAEILSMIYCNDGTENNAICETTFANNFGFTLLRNTIEK